MISGVLLDLDGTVYIGGTAVPGSVDTLEALRRMGVRILFMTNRSTRRPAAVADKLQILGIECEESEVLTSAMATARYLTPGRVYCLGEEGLVSALVDQGFVLVDKSPEYVVVGMDREITYGKLTYAARWIHGGAQFVATNCDGMVNSEGGISPGAGAIVSAVATASGAQPLVIGKPERPIFDMAMRELSLPKEGIVMVGDNLATDVLGGHSAGLRTALVTTGITPREAVQQLQSPPPTWIIDDLTGLLDLVKGSQ